MINIPQNISSYIQCVNAVCFYRKGSAVKGQVTFFKHGNKLLGIGCYHVLCANELARKIYSIDFDNAESSPLVLIQQATDGKECEIGKVIYGRLNNREDIAIVEVTHADQIQMKLMPKFLNINDRDLFIIKSNETVLTIAVIDGNAQCEIIMNGQLKITLKGLIKTHKCSVKGDSGTLVWDKTGNLKGLIEADNKMHSYIIPLRKY